MMDREQAPLAHFSVVARRFCDWAVGTDGSEMDMASARAQLAVLYAAGTALLVAEDEESELAGSVTVPAELVERVAVRAATLPVDAYWEVFDPLANPPEQPVVGSLVDDLCDIFHDVMRGVQLFDAGRPAEAHALWAFFFTIHWGEHAAGALRALHAHLAREDGAG